jgi:O-antigen/teichoic acid export membrane protein
MIAQTSKFVLQIGSTVVLARLLTPQDYGLIGMATTITVFVAMFKDMGLSTATIQKAEINHGQISTLFWVNVVFSSATMLLTAAIAPVVAWFYGEPRLTWIILVSASGFIFGGLTVQHQALLNRQMRFTALATIDIASMLIGIATAIVLAWYGAGYWALVFMQLATGIATTVGVWVMCAWRPGLPVRHSGVRSMLAFGGNLTGFSVINYFARNLDNVLIGRYWGVQQLGVYAKAYQLLLLPIQQINAPISSVALPTLSRIQNQPEQYCAYYRKAVLSIAALGMPLVAFLFVAADKLILALLGEQWVDAILIFRVLAPAAFVGTFNMATGWVYMSLGQPHRQFRWGILTSTMTVLGFAIGIHWGAVGVAAAFSIVFCCLTMGPLSIIYCFRYSPLKISDLMGALWRPALASVTAGALLFAASYLFTFKGNSLIGLLIDFSIYVLFYILLWSVLPNGRQLMREILGLAKAFRRQPQQDDNTHS